MGNHDYERKVTKDIHGDVRLTEKWKVWGLHSGDVGWNVEVWYPRTGRKSDVRLSRTTYRDPSEVPDEVLDITKEKVENTIDSKQESVQEEQEEIEALSDVMNKL